MSAFFFRLNGYLQTVICIKSRLNGFKDIIRYGIFLRVLNQKIRRPLTGGRNAATTAWILHIYHRRDIFQHRHRLHPKFRIWCYRRSQVLHPTGVAGILLNGQYANLISIILNGDRDKIYTLNLLKTYCFN